MLNTVRYLLLHSSHVSSELQLLFIHTGSHFVKLIGESVLYFVGSCLHLFRSDFLHFSNLFVDVFSQFSKEDVLLVHLVLVVFLHYRQSLVEFDALESHVCLQASYSGSQFLSEVILLAHLDLSF